MSNVDPLLTAIQPDAEPTPEVLPALLELMATDDDDSDTELARLANDIRAVMRDRWKSQTDVTLELLDCFIRYSFPLQDAINMINDPDVQAYFQLRAQANQELYDVEMTLLAAQAERAVLREENRKLARQRIIKCYEIIEMYEASCEDGSIEYLSPKGRARLERLVAEAREDVGELS
ncbi:unnamed protein product [Peniophora sp. CBMAI 1063]|nr:unnamed protein product [Peniophora sp. CBMAI 1063]